MKGKGVKKTDIFLKRIETMILSGYMPSFLATRSIFVQLDRFMSKTSWFLTPFLTKFKNTPTVNEREKHGIDFRF
jgi:hypothetical protein